MTSTEPTAPLPDSWKAEEAEAMGGGRTRTVVAIVVGVLVVLLVAAGAFLFISRDDADRAWPPSVNGRPAGLGGEGTTTEGLTPDTEPGVYIWSGFDGWHLWVVNGDGLQGATGTITSNTDIQRAGASSPADGTVSTDGKTITFDLDGDAPVVGVDFDPALAKRLEFEIDGPDGPIDATLVVTGTEQAAIDGLPLVIDKLEVSDGS